MKKFGVLVILLVGLCGCSPNNANVNLSSNQMNEQEVELDLTKQDQSAVVEDECVSECGITENEIRRLVDENMYCMNQIFILASLPTTGEAINGELLYQVDESCFKDYTVFETYIRSIYAQEEADRLLFNYPYEGAQKYVDYEGKLCVDLTYDGAKGYFVDWTNYEVTIDSCQNERCYFKLKAKIEEPAEEPIWEDYFVKGEVVLENGQWLLTQMLY